MYKVPITLETYVPPPTPPARIAAVTFSTTTLSLSGSQWADYTATLVNEGQSPIASVWVQGWAVQGSATRAAGGGVVNCTTELGALPPGNCTFRFSFRASNAGGGTGTLVPGPATATLELRWEYGIISTFTTPITLVN